MCTTPPLEITSDECELREHVLDDVNTVVGMAYCDDQWSEIALFVMDSVVRLHNTYPGIYTDGDDLGLIQMLVRCIDDPTRPTLSSWFV